MKYIRYGVTLTLMRESDLEMVRQWRNDPVVVRNYAYREYITPEMQTDWFKTVNNHRNLYTIIHYRGEQVGVINLKHIDWEQKTFEGGIFIPYERHHNTPLPAIVSVLTTEIPFTWFDWNVGYAHVLQSNKQTQAFIRQLGYELSPGQESVENQEYRITRENYLRKSARLKKAIFALTGEEAPGILVIEKEDEGSDAVAFFEEKAKTSKALIGCRETPEGRVYTFS